MLHANEFQLRTAVFRFRGEEKARVLQRLAQSGGSDDFKIEIETGTVAATIAGLFGGMKLRNDACAERAELDRRAVFPMAATAHAPLREPGEQAAVIAEERTGHPVLIREKKRKKIAEPAEEHLVIRREKLGAIGRLIAKTAHLERNCGSLPSASAS